MTTMQQQLGGMFWAEVERWRRYVAPAFIIIIIIKERKERKEYHLIRRLPPGRSIQMSITTKS